MAHVWSDDTSSSGAQIVAMFRVFESLHSKMLIQKIKAKSSSSTDVPPPAATAAATAAPRLVVGGLLMKKHYEMMRPIT